MIYLAIPHTHPDPHVRELRCVVSDILTGVLFARGEMVFAPITHCHRPAQHCTMPYQWEFWKAYDEKMISVCSTIMVTMIPGWEVSVGVNAERKIAQELGISELLISPEDFLEDAHLPEEARKVLRDTLNKLNYLDVKYNLADTLRDMNKHFGFDEENWEIWIQDHIICKHSFPKIPTK